MSVHEYVGVDRIRYRRLTIERRLFVRRRVVISQGNDGTAGALSARRNVNSGSGVTTVGVRT